MTSEAAQVETIHPRLKTLNPALAREIRGRKREMRKLGRGAPGDLRERGKITRKSLNWLAEYPYVPRIDQVVAMNIMLTRQFAQRAA